MGDLGFAEGGFGAGGCKRFEEMIGIIQTGF